MCVDAFVFVSYSRRYFKLFVTARLYSPLNRMSQIYCIRCRNSSLSKQILRSLLFVVSVYVFCSKLTAVFVVYKNCEANPTAANPLAFVSG